VSGKSSWGAKRLATPSITVRAAWDPDAKVWVATSEDAPMLRVDAETLAALSPRVFEALRAHAAADGVAFEETDLPVTILM
jgi:hypothetical protein